MNGFVFGWAELFTLNSKKLLIALMICPFNDEVLLLHTKNV